MTAEQQAEMTAAVSATSSTTETAAQAILTTVQGLQESLTTESSLATVKEKCQPDLANSFVYLEYSFNWQAPYRPQ